MDEQETVALEMVWPEAPTCHTQEPSLLARSYPHCWKMRDDGLRHCSYCGSLHPEDLIAAIAKGATLGGSDWKYGYPHKFYVTIPTAGYAKFYTSHLNDEGYSDAALDKTLAVLTEHSGITWVYRPEKGVGYIAPYPGYQK